MKKYKCVKGDDINFTEGKTYTLQDNGNVEGNDGYKFFHGEYDTAIEWLEIHGFRFEATSKFENIDIFEQVVQLLHSGCTGVSCDRDCAFNAIGVCGMALLRDAMSRMEGATEVECGKTPYNRQDYMHFASVNEPHK